MLTEKQTLLIAKQALKKFKVNCEVKFIPYDKYLETAKKSPLISEILSEGFSFNELKIPALVEHELKEHIFLSKKIINYLLKNKPLKVQKDFVKAVLYHELFHIKNRRKVTKKNYLECQKSEDAVCNEFRKEYPEIYKLGYEIHKKATEI